MGAEARFSESVLYVEPGDSAITQVTVRNNGSVVDQFGFNVLGDAAGWAFVEPSTVSLFPGSEDTVTLSFTPPRKPETPAGPMPFGLRVISAEDPGGSTVEEGTLNVGPFTDVLAELVPHAIRGRLRGRTQLGVDNRSNVPYRAELGASDPDGAVGVSFAAPFLDIAPGSVAFTRAVVRNRFRLWRGASVSRPFQVLLRDATAAPAGEDVLEAAPTSVHPPEVVAEGVMLQDALLPSWLWKLVAVLLALAVLCLILWFNLLKPQIQAATQNQVATQLAHAGIVPTTVASGGGSGTQGNGSGSQSGGKQHKSGPPVSSTVGPVSQSLFLTGNGVTTYTVPSEDVLQVTDMLVQNTGGNSGVVELERTGAPLMRWAMVDFRDLDYHWVTPITFGGSSEIQLALKGCSGTCTVGIYFAGNLVRS